MGHSCLAFDEARHGVFIRNTEKSTKQVFYRQRCELGGKVEKTKSTTILLATGRAAL